VFRKHEVRKSYVVHTIGSNITTVDSVSIIFYGDPFMGILSVLVFSMMFLTLFNLSVTLFYLANRVTLRSNHFA